MPPRMSGPCRAFRFMRSANFPIPGLPFSAPVPTAAWPKRNLNVQLGGIAAAVDLYDGQVTPNLLIVETRLQGEAALEELDRLAEVCDPATKVVVIGRVNDVRALSRIDAPRRGGISGGAAQSAASHRSDFRVFISIRDAAPIGRVVAFIGARGGAGSSTLAHNVGWCIAEELTHQHHDRRFRSAVRHGRASISTRNRARASPTRCRARASRRRAARPPADEARRSSLAVHRARGAGTRL